MLNIPPSASLPVAAVDLGSNSFHMIVAEFRSGELIIVDKLREMIRLGAGLTPQRHLSPEAQNRALACLARFGERLRDFPTGTVRAVGTNTLRTARNGPQFLVLAERALGHPIEIISGIEEARLIYMGVSRSYAVDGKRRLVMDIGGGSTEYIIGVDHEPRHKESLSMGCVSMSMAHFGDGKISAKRFRKAVLAAEQELEPFQLAFQRGNWDEAVGASGTIRAVRKILTGRKWCREGINRESLDRLVESVLTAGIIDRQNFPDLNPERYPSFVGGLAVLHA
ncbi:Ppx/GppA family phosphatase, partial [Candidatus Woesearchaeota archaeon]|nr:Ppx/GppA family phosphatase [Candidatus Woesearchaeota archaeon]